MATVTTCPHGQYEHGQPAYKGNGTWCRLDKWTAKDGRTDTDLLFVDGPNDDSQLFDTTNGHDGACSCCYLGFPHSHNAHLRRLT